MFNSIDNEILFIDAVTYLRYPPKSYEEALSDYMRSNYCWARSTEGYCSWDKDTIQKAKDDVLKNKPGKNLYFDKNSNFPRTKLSSNYKRVIKEPKSDSVIIPDFEIGFNIRLTGREIDQFYGYSLNNTYILFFNTSNIPNIEEQLNINFRDKFEQNIQSLGEVKCYTASIKIINFMRSIKNYNKSKLVFDSVLDKEVNAQSESLDKDAVTSIWGMLSSTDKQICGVGLKVLASYNVIECRNTVYYMLAYNATNYYSCPEVTSTIVKQMMDTIEFYKGTTFASNGISYAPERFISNLKLKNFSPLDIELFKYATTDLLNIIKRKNEQMLNDMTNNEITYNISIDAK